ncbi:2-acylglycerol O-acyltransferase 2-like [Galendromus occidentalis]|uniref:diacylglycerol O-acyltransferase n=1 Tax=Galendromus occidentalis TaxID=34638 RepID=A0AAJ6QT32_9ACAR|nr:2-acylglycerol O-acyltransferase 2-like [Galendromus occidentalis]
MYVYFVSGITGYYVLIYSLWTRFWFLTLAYVLWVIYDNLSLPRVHRYDPKKTYICGYHPHGVMPNGAVLGVLSNGLNIDQKLPGIKASLCSLGLIHWSPIMREVGLLLGCVNVDRATIRHLLKRPGRMLLIAIGGAAESLEVENSRYRLILRHRKGFVREAIISGSCLVPIFSFGENDGLPIVKTAPGSFGRKCQDFCKFWTRATIPLIKGRSVFGVPIPIFPFRKPVNIVFGPPIEVAQDPSPRNEQVDELHGRYMEELHRLFEANKDRFEPQATLEFI